MLIALSMLMLCGAGVYAQDATDQQRNASNASPSGDTAADDGAAGEQSPGSVPANEKPAWQEQAGTSVSAPDVFLLPDASGKLRRILGFRYEDFLNAWKRGRAVEVDATPRFSIESWQASGRVVETRALVRVELEVQPRASGWIGVPIQLPELIVQKWEITDKSAGECIVYSEAQHGYVVWLSNPEGVSRSIALEGLVKLNSGGLGLELHVPRAVTSRFDLTLPSNVARIESSPEINLERKKRDDGLTEVQLTGQANPIRVDWTESDVNATDERVLMEVKGQTRVQVERGRATYRSTLEIDSFDSPLDTIRVKLPRRAKLIMLDDQKGYEYQFEEDPSSPEDRQIVEIRSVEAKEGPWNLTLVAERPIESFGESAECRIEGFEVLDAFQQSGRVTLEIDDQLQAYFDTHGDIQQVPLSSPTAKKNGTLAIGEFRYTRFPWQIVTFTTPRQRRVSVQPGYSLKVGSDEARLDVQYEYRLTGAKVFSLRVDLQGWELTEIPIESNGAVDANGIVETLDNRLILPLADTATEQLRINLSLRKDIQLGENSFELPEPLSAFVLDGEFTASATGSLQIVPKLTAMNGMSVLSRSPLVPPVASSDASSSNDVLRMRTFLPQPKFVAEIRQRESEISAFQQTDVKLDRDNAQVTQLVEYDAKYAPVSRVRFTVPEALSANGSLKFLMDGTELPVAIGSPSDEASTGDGTTDRATSATEQQQIVVTLPRPLQNEFSVAMSYQTAMPELDEDQLAPLLLPLAIPTVPVTGHRATIGVPSSMSVMLNQRSAADDWNVVLQESGNETTDNVLTLQTEENSSYISLFAQLEPIDTAQLATLERAWIQSWVAIGQRQQRAVFRFRTTHPGVYVQLPEGFDNVELEVLLDGQPWAYEVLDDNRLAISLATTKSAKRHTLELRYYENATIPSWGELDVSLPRLESRLSSAPIYWQLILPEGWQVWSSPSQLIPDYWLGWKDFRWGRQPSLSQADFEQLTDAVSSIEPTPMSAQYTYRAFKIPVRLQFSVIRQSWVFLACAFVAFALGALWLYTKLLHSGMFWLCIATALLLGVFSYPEMTLILIEVILVGGLMTFVTSILKRVFVDADDPSSQVVAYPQTQSEITETWQQQRLSGSQAVNETTATVQTGGPSA